MLDPFIIVKGIRDVQSDPNWPVLLEIERQRPGYRRRTVMGIAGLWLLNAVLLFWMLMGWEIYW